MELRPSRRALRRSRILVEAAGTNLAPTTWMDRQVVDVHGLVIGMIVAVYLEPATTQPAWLGIDVGGLDSLGAVLAPVAGARLVAGVVVVADEHEMVVNTPVALISVLALELGDRKHGDDLAHRTRGCGRR